MSPEAAPATSRARRLRASLSVALVLVLAGLLFTANARLAQGEESRYPEDLAQLVDQESRRNAGLASQVDALDDEIAQLSASAPSVPGSTSTSSTSTR